MRVVERKELRNCYNNNKVKFMKISIIIPLYNSAAFQDDLLSALDAERLKHKWDLEVILVDDGSRDHGYEKAIQNQKKYSFVKAIKLSRNFGHQAAVRVGLEFATGDCVGIMDDDLQDPPSIVYQFIEKIQSGYDVVYGVRCNRKESLLLKASYKLFYRLLKRIADINIPIDSGDFCFMTKRVVEQMRGMPEQQPFIRGMRAWVGFKQIGHEYERAARFSGKSGYTFSKLFRLALDGLFSFSTVPLRLITLAGLIGSLISLSYGVLILWLYFYSEVSVKGFTTIILLLTIYSSLILFCLGIVGEYISRIYLESKKRPFAVIMEKYNL